MDLGAPFLKVHTSSNVFPTGTAIPSARLPEDDVPEVYEDF